MEKEKSKAEIMEEVWGFANQIGFKSPENPMKLKGGLKPADVFRKLSFSEVQLEDLDEDLQKAIQKNREWAGHPLQGAQGSSKKPNVRIFKSKDGNSVYCVEDKGSKYAWSKIDKTKDGYRIHVISTQDRIIDIINSFSFYEIAHAQNAAYFPKYDNHEKQMINIPVGAGRVVEDTRDQVIGLS